PPLAGSLAGPVAFSNLTSFASDFDALLLMTPAGHTILLVTYPANSSFVRFTQKSLYSLVKGEEKPILALHTGCFPLVFSSGKGNSVCLSTFCQRSGLWPNNSLATISVKRASKCIASCGNTIGVFIWMKIRSSCFFINLYFFSLLLKVRILINHFFDTFTDFILNYLFSLLYKSI